MNYSILIKCTSTVGCLSMCTWIVETLPGVREINVTTEIHKILFKLS